MTKTIANGCLAARFPILGVNWVDTYSELRGVRYEFASISLVLKRALLDSGICDTLARARELRGIYASARQFSRMR